MCLGEQFAFAEVCLIRLYGKKKPTSEQKNPNFEKLFLAGESCEELRLRAYFSLEDNAYFILPQIEASLKRYLKEKNYQTSVILGTDASYCEACTFYYKVIFDVDEQYSKLLDVFSGHHFTPQEGFELISAKPLPKELRDNLENPFYYQGFDVESIFFKKKNIYTDF